MSTLRIPAAVLREMEFAARTHRNSPEQRKWYGEALALLGTSVARANESTSALHQLAKAGVLEPQLRDNRRVYDAKSVARVAVLIHSTTQSTTTKGA